jgi:hypothetical protein
MTASCNRTYIVDGETVTITEGNNYMTQQKKTRAKASFKAPCVLCNGVINAGEWIRFFGRGWVGHKPKNFWVHFDCSVKK